MEKDLQQHISKFIAHIVEISAVHRVEEFVGFLEQISAQGVVRLLALPRPLSTKPIHYLHRVDESLTGAGHRAGDYRFSGRDPRPDLLMFEVR